MSERIIASGSDFMAFFVEGEEGAETFRPIAGQTNCTLTREANYRETNNKNLNGYKDYNGGLKGWGASVDMDIPDPADVNADEVDYEEIDALAAAYTKQKVRFCYVTVPADETDEDPVPDTSKPSYEGLVLCSAPRNAPSGENQTTTIAMQGCRKLATIPAV